ncbi:hypothetical protein ACF061_00770 [Streptomyces sp. NPDC015220]|uniref:hypothetical protein n=1 Tax=Streptomyces sp. NPDC015220 TaxID=3364947 RepID=UPI0036FB1742
MPVVLPIPVVVTSHQCIPGLDCGCDSWPEACCHQDGPETLNQPITNCPHWEART